MAAICLFVDQDADSAFKLAAAVARSLHYSVAYLRDGELALRRGNLLTGLVVGPFIPYCDFRMTIRTQPPAGTEIRLEINKPWWSGTIGMGRVRSRAEELANAIELAVRENGGKVEKRNEG